MLIIRRIVSFVIVLTFLMSISVGAFAAEYNIADGDVSVHAGESGQTVSQGGSEAVPATMPRKCPAA